MKYIKIIGFIVFVLSILESPYAAERVVVAEMITDES